MKVIHVNQVNENIEIQFRIMNGAQPFNVPEGVSCTIRGTKGDNFGYAAAVAVTAGSNIVTVTLTEQLTAVAGAGNIFELVFVGASDDMKVSTENFLLDVERAALGEDTVISDSDLAYADQVLDQLQSVGAVNAQVQQNKANITAEITRATAAEQTLQQNINAEAAARQAADNTLQSNINAEASSRATTDASLQSQINQLVAPSGEAPSAAEVQNARIGTDGTVYPTLGDAIRTQNSLLKSQLEASCGLGIGGTTTATGLTYYWYPIQAGKQYVFELVNPESNGAFNLESGNSVDQYVESLATVNKSNPIVTFTPTTDAPKIRVFTSRVGTFRLYWADGLEAKIADHTEEIQNLNAEIDDLSNISEVIEQFYQKRVINDYNPDNVSAFGTIGNTHVYFITRPIEVGEILESVKIYAPTSGTLTLSLCTLDFDTNKAKLIKNILLSLSSGENDLTLDEPYEAEVVTYIGLSGSGVLMYKNDNISPDTYGTGNKPLYEASGAISTSGTAFTTNANANFLYTVSVSVIKRTFATKEELSNYATKSEVEAIEVKCGLDQGNMLRYHRAENGEYTLWGRWFDMTVNGTNRKVTNNAGSEIMFFVSGASSIAFAFDQKTPNTIDPYMAFSVDGGEFTRVQISNNSVTLTLPDTSEHLVRMSIDAISETDNAYKWNGTNAFALVSITPDAGTMIAINPTNKVGMYFGDSLTEGVNVLGTGGNNNVESATQAYSYWTARNLNSIRYCIGYGGSGITKTGSFRPCIDAINYYKDGVSTDVYYPDYIVINHGVNDYATVSSADFCAAYKTVIDRLRIKYPGVYIFMVYPFMASTNTKYVDGMTALADLYDNVYFINTLGWNGETTDGTHLSANGAKNNGEKLASEIIKVLGKSFFI